VCTACSIPAQIDARGRSSLDRMRTCCFGVTTDSSKVEGARSARSIHLRDQDCSRNSAGAPTLHPISTGRERRSRRRELHRSFDRVNIGFDIIASVHEILSCARTLAECAREKLLRRLHWRFFPTDESSRTADESKYTRDLPPCDVRTSRRMSYSSLCRRALPFCTSNWSLCRRAVSLCTTDMSLCSPAETRKCTF
jgi:hypothetical protein